MNENQVNLRIKQVAVQKGSIKVGRLLLLAAASQLLLGCVFIPSAGPLKSEVSNEHESEEQSRSFELVDVSSATVRVLSQRDGVSLAESVGTLAPPPSLTVGKGDALNISIWEAGSQPLFSSSSLSSASSAGARAATISGQVVDSDGSISIPYAGRVKVEGLTLADAERSIEKSLRGKTARAQVLVSKSNGGSDAVTVLGEVNAAGRITLSPRGERLLDVLASAGGLRTPSYETWISLTRDNKTTRVPLPQILANSRENVFMHPGDLVSVTREAQSYTAFGATGVNAQIRFDSERMNLVEAVAKAGGLNDQRADPRGVYLLRREPAAIARALEGAGAMPGEDGSVPVVYRLDMTRVESYFLGREFQVRNGDIIYVASAPSTTIQKILQLFGLLTQPIVQGVVLDSAVD